MQLSQPHSLENAALSEADRHNERESALFRLHRTPPAWSTALRLVFGYGLYCCQIPRTLRVLWLYKDLYRYQHHLGWLLQTISDLRFAPS